MLKVKLVLLSTLALLAMGLVTSSYASATTNWVICYKLETNEGTYTNAECTKAGKGKYLKEELRENEHVNFEGEGGPSKLEGLFTIECKKDTSGGNLGGGASLEGTITFAECKIPGRSECTVSKDKWEVRGEALFPEETAEFVLKIEPGSEVMISGTSCPYTGKLKIKGKQICSMPNMLKLKRTNEINCKPEGSEIEGKGEAEGEKGKALTFTDTEKVKLATGTAGDYWGL